METTAARTARVSLLDAHGEFPCGEAHPSRRYVDGLEQRHHAGSVDARPWAAKVNELAAHGVDPARAAREAGVSRATVEHVLYGTVQAIGAATARKLGALLERHGVEPPPGRDGAKR